MNCALKTIERVRFAVHHNLKSLVVVTDVAPPDPDGESDDEE